MARKRISSARPGAGASFGPVRTCVGCRRRASKSELLRVIAGSDPHGRPVVAPDPAATAPGRGAHLHPTTECYDLAVRRKAFARALRTTGGERGLSNAPVAEYLSRSSTSTSTDQAYSTDRNWSSSS